MKLPAPSLIESTRRRMLVKSGCCPTCWIKFGRAMPVFNHEKCPFCGQHHAPIAPPLPVFDPSALIDPDELVLSTP